MATNLSKLTTLEQLRLLAIRTQEELEERDQRIDEIVSTGGEPNVLVGVKVNGIAQAIAEKMVDILIKTGSANGTLSVAGVDVAVKGLAALAYKAQVSESDLDSALKAVLDAKALATDVTALEGVLNAVKEDVDTFFVNADLTANAKDTLKEIQDYINSDAGAAAEMTASIQQNATNIANLVTLVGQLPSGATATTVVGYIAEAIAAIGIGDYAKTSEMNAAISEALASYYTKTEADNKFVAKVSGKDLSTNDYTTAEKEKLAGITVGATKVEKSTVNGNVKLNGVELVVYAEPGDVLHGEVAADSEVNTMLTEVFGA